jgi:hypothetical protein
VILVTSWTKTTWGLNRPSQASRKKAAIRAIQLQEAEDQAAVQLSLSGRSLSAVREAVARTTVARTRAAIPAIRARAVNRRRAAMRVIQARAATQVILAQEGEGRVAVPLSFSDPS